MTGSGGCNTLNGPATVGEGTIAFGPIATTRMACPEGVMGLEAHVLAVLDGEVTYTIDGDVLTLTNEAAEVGLGLRAPARGLSRVASDERPWRCRGPQRMRPRNFGKMGA